MQHAPGFLRLVADALTRVREASLDETLDALARRDGTVVLDVREESEWAAGHIPGALHLGKGILERDIERVVPDPATPVILYCGGGYRSALAGDAMMRMGYRDVRSMAGGWRAFTQRRDGTPTG